MPRIVVILISVLLTACEAEKAYQSQAEEVFPPVPVARAALFRLDKLGVSPAFFMDKWTAVVFGKAACEQGCQQRLAVVNALEDAQALLVIEDIANHAQMRALGERFPNVEVSMGVTAASIDNFKAQFEDEAIAASDMAGYIHIVNNRAELSYRLPAEQLQTGDINRELAALKSGA